MYRPLCYLVLLSCSLASVVSAQTVIPTFVPSQTNVPSFDPLIFGPGPNIDIWNLVLTNESAEPVTSLELEICQAPGTVLNLGSPGVDFRDTTDPVMLGPNLVADSFFVVPEGTTALVGDFVETDLRFGAAWTVAGDVPLVEGNGGQAIVAVLAVPTGTFDPLAVRNPLGRASIAGQFATVGFLTDPFDNCIPEPTTAVLLGLGLACLGGSRRKFVDTLFTRGSNR
ncbi:MAG: PEP-CTERM sorting domain-containing protein [Planctomycetota bacterium]